MDMNSKIKVLSITYGALYVALYIALKWIGNLIPFLQMPNGGSIELELIAIFVASYHLGWKYGGIIAILSWVLTIFLGFTMWFVKIPQIFLDYILPLLVCGLASLLWPFNKSNKALNYLMAVLLAVAAFFGISRSWNGTTAIVVAVIASFAVLIFTIWYLSTRQCFGVVLSMVLKYIFQVLSGVYYWMPEGSLAGSSEAWIFSLGYNLWYNLVTMIVCIFLVPLLINSLKKAKISFTA